MRQPLLYFPYKAESAHSPAGPSANAEETRHIFSRMG